MTKVLEKHAQEVIPYIIENIIDFSRDMASNGVGKMMKKNLLPQKSKWSADGLIRLGYASGMDMTKWFGDYSLDVVLSVYDNCVADKKYLDNMIVYWIRKTIPNYLP